MRTPAIAHTGVPTETAFSLAGWYASRCIGAVTFMATASHFAAERAEIKRYARVYKRYVRRLRLHGHELSAADKALLAARYWEKRLDVLTAALRRWVVDLDGPRKGLLQRSGVSAA